MTTMVPGRPAGVVSLADLLPGCVSALRGEPNALGFPRASSVVVVVVDGLGASVLNERAAYARTLSASRESMFSGFPTTTAAALTTITTGALPGTHGLVGYTVLDAANDRVVKQLSGWDARLDPTTWQRVPTIFEQLGGTEIQSFAVGAKRYATSGLTKAILRGATYVSAESIGDRFAAAQSILDSRVPALTYLYVPELDMAAHRVGWQSDDWAAALEAVDAEVRGLVTGLRADQAVVVTADHGVIDVSARKHVLYGHKPELVDGLRHVAGDPRCLQLHVEPGLDVDAVDRLVAAWRASESDRSWVVTRAEAVEAGWFGEVDPVVAARIGDVLVAARKGIAYYDGRDDENHRRMIGQHGSWSSEETQVPLLRFGAFAPR